MLGKKIGIDLGTTTVRMVVKGEGMLVTEPSVVAMRDGDASGSMIGLPALEAVADDRRVRALRPLQSGAIADPVAMRLLVQHVVTRAVGRQRIFKPDVVVAVMSTLPPDQRRLLLEAGMLAGARTVYLLDAAIAAGLGAGVPLGSGNAHLVIEMGAGKTEVALLALEGTIAGTCLAGHGAQRLAAAVGEHVRAAHDAMLTPAVVEDVLASLARAGTHEERRMEVRGRADGGERAVTIMSTELVPLIDAHLRPIAHAVEEVLADAPPVLIADVREEGGVLCGGGSLLEGADRWLTAATGMPMRRDGDPLLSVVRGTGYASDNLDVLKRTFMYIR